MAAVNYLLKFPSPKTVTMKVRTLTYESEGLGAAGRGPGNTVQSMTTIWWLLGGTGSKHSPLSCLTKNSARVEAATLPKGNCQKMCLVVQWIGICLPTQV